MISVDSATRCIAQAMPARPAQSIRIADAVGKILAQDVLAERAQPPFDRVMMDGIAIAFSAFDNGRRNFHCQGIQAAGAARQVLSDPANCIEIMTGAVLPENCDCIIPIEQIRLTEQRAEVAADHRPSSGQFIHRRGSDYGRDEVLLRRGSVIGGPEAAVLASAGSATVEVAQAPTIVIFAVGDELVEPGAELGPAKIRRSNDYAIAALLQNFGLTNNRRSHLPDNPEILRDAIGQALCQFDVVILTGGVSMGKYDYIPSIMDELGVEILLHKVSQKPGKPMWVGRKAGRMVFALPGNPVSSLVCARRYVIPAIDGSMGYQAGKEWVSLGQSLQRSAPLTWFVPVTLRPDAVGVAEPRLTNTSGDFHTLAGTTGFIELPDAQAEYPIGFPALLWRW